MYKEITVVHSHSEEEKEQVQQGNLALFKEATSCHLVEVICHLAEEICHLVEVICHLVEEICHLEK